MCHHVHSETCLLKSRKGSNSVNPAHRPIQYNSDFCVRTERVVSRPTHRGFFICCIVMAQLPSTTTPLRAHPHANPRNSPVGGGFSGIWKRLIANSTPPTSATPVGGLQRELPLQYSDCAGYEEKAAWVYTERGLDKVNAQPLLKEYHADGTLLQMMRDPAWDEELNGWFHIDKEKEQTPEPEEDARKIPDLGIVHNHPPYQELFKGCPTFLQRMDFPTAGKYDILTDGYTVFRGLISECLVAGAVEALNRMTSQSEEFSRSSTERFLREQLLHPADHFTSFANTNNPDVLALYYCSPIHALVVSLLYNEAASIHSFTPLVDNCQVVYRYPQPHPYWYLASTKSGGRAWHLDGFNREVKMPFSLLIGIALSDQTHDKSGNLGVHPGSHHTLTPFLKEYNAACDLSGNEKKSRVSTLLHNLPDLGEPLQLKLNCGDVVIALYRTAHLGTRNHSKDVRKMVYFRVSHRDLATFRDAPPDELWIEYEGMEEILH